MAEAARLPNWTAPAAPTRLRQFKQLPDPVKLPGAAPPDAVVVVALLPLWSGGHFDGDRLHRAILTRGWTVTHFAALAGIADRTLKNALAGEKCTDVTALRVYDALGRKKPVQLPEEFA